MEAERKDKEKPELERLLGELARANASIKERDVRDAVIEVVSEKKYGAKNPRAVYRLVKDDLEMDDKGSITNQGCAQSSQTRLPELFVTANASIDGNRAQRRARRCRYERSNTANAPVEDYPLSYNNITTRAETQALVPEVVSDAILTDLQTDSAALSLFSSSADEHFTDTYAGFGRIADCILRAGRYGTKANNRSQLV
jgi:hypothetical protein